VDAADERMASGRSDLTELAALLNEIRQTWRPLDWPDRDRMRRLVLEGLYRFRGQQGNPGQPPEDCPHDVSGLVDEPAETLLHLLKTARFNEAQLQEKLDRVLAGTDVMREDAEARAARCASLLDRRRKTVPMDALRAALYPEAS
jgi:hypothetical protein